MSRSKNLKQNYIPREMSQSARPSKTRSRGRGRGGRAGKRVVKNSKDDLEEILAARRKAEEEFAPFLEKGQDLDFRVDRKRLVASKPEPGPMTYNPDIFAIRPRTTGCAFGRSARFKSTRKNGTTTGAGPFISRHHMADFVGDSPGPLHYRIKGFPTSKRIPGLFWGSQTGNDERRQRQQQKAIATGVGPSAYKPNHDLLKRVNPRATIGPGYKESVQAYQRKIEKINLENQKEDEAEQARQDFRKRLDTRTADIDQWRHVMPYVPQHSFAKPGSHPTKFRVSENAETKFQGPASILQPNFDIRKARAPKMPFAMQKRFRQDNGM